MNQPVQSADIHWSYQRLKDAQLPTVSSPSPYDLYLDLLERVLTRTGFPASYRMVRGEGWRAKVYTPLSKFLESVGLEVVRRADAEQREYGRDVPLDAETMAGVRRLQDLRRCIEAINAEDVPGDLIETGVWRGGTCIYMRGVLKALGCSDRRVWVADSFQGLPPVDTAAYPADAADTFGQWHKVVVSSEEVAENFRRYGLLDDQVVFLEGWFQESLPAAPIDSLALLRLDCDLYSSTMDVLTTLYDRVSPGGYVVVDDYSIATCRKAVEDFRSARHIRAELVDIDGTAVRWQRSS